MQVLSLNTDAEPDSNPDRDPDPDPDPDPADPDPDPADPTLLVMIAEIQRGALALTPPVR